MTNNEYNALNSFIDFISLKSDITIEELNIVESLLKNNNTFDSTDSILITKAKQLLNSYYNKRLLEFRNLFDIVVNKNLTNIEKYLLYYKEFPYLDTVNIDKEKMIFNKFYSDGVPHSNYLDMSKINNIFINDIFKDLSAEQKKQYEDCVRLINKQGTADIRTMQTNMFLSKKHSENEIIERYNYIDYVTDDYQRNCIKGEYGELLIYNNEKNKLIKEGKSDLADRIIWVSHEIGDCFGFDILSFNPDGSPKPIEVKTFTSYNPKNKIILTDNEYDKFNFLPNYQVLVVNLSINCFYIPLYEDITCKSIFNQKK